MSDVLRMEYINSLPHPLMATFFGGDEWPIYYVCVQTGLMKIDVCGMLDNKCFGEVKFITDADGEKHDAEVFYVDYEESQPASQQTGEYHE